MPMQPPAPAHSPGVLQGKRVIELGAGVGLTGVCISHLSPASLLLTDYDVCAPLSLHVLIGHIVPL